MISAYYKLYKLIVNSRVNSVNASAENIDFLSDDISHIAVWQLARTRKLRKGIQGHVEDKN